MPSASPPRSMVELRKIVNHPLLCYPDQYDVEAVGVGPSIVRSCGKFWVLDRLLVRAA